MRKAAEKYGKPQKSTGGRRKMRKATGKYGSLDARWPCFLAAVSVSRPGGAGQADDQG